uniref:Uncharacterized protein n=1 Tax=Tanacetum cinerariifolium TaxID=118510 RepID=A0A6L2LRJ1_TANCI|nr:hypothetical protein [Tanacetum cinerariifolium]
MHKESDDGQKILIPSTKNKKKIAKEEIEERLISLVASLFLCRRILSFREGIRQLRYTRAEAGWGAAVEHGLRYRIMTNLKPQMSRDFVSLGHGSGSKSRDNYDSVCNLGFLVNARAVMLANLQCNIKGILMINPKYVGKLHHIDSPLFEPYVAIATLMHVATYQALLSKHDEEGQSVRSHVLNMKSYIDKLERLGNPLPHVLAVNTVLEYAFQECHSKLAYDKGRRKIGHWKMNCPSYLVELKRGKQTGSSAKPVNEK